MSLINQMLKDLENRSRPPMKSDAILSGLNAKYIYYLADKKPHPTIWLGIGLTFRSDDFLLCFN